MIRKIATLLFCSELYVHAGDCNGFYERIVTGLLMGAKSLDDRYWRKTQDSNKATVIFLKTGLSLEMCYYNSISFNYNLSRTTCV